MAYAKCFECGDEFQIGSEDTGVITEAVIPICCDCEEDYPEHVLWDVTAIQENQDLGWKLPSETPLDEDEDWAVRDRYADKKTYAQYLNDISDVSFDENDENLTLPDDSCWEIFVRSSDNTEAIDEAREAVKELQ
jgi:hypothetical protein